MKDKFSENTNNLSEHMEQVLLVNMALKHEKEIPELKLLYAIPNGGQRHKAIAQKLKMEGVKKGVPDLCLPVAKKPYNGLYIEMKRRTGGNVSVDQKKWLQRLNKAGYLAVVAHGCDEAWEVLMNYLNNGGLK